MNVRPCVILLAVGLLLGVSACGKKAAVKGQLAGLEEAFAASGTNELVNAAVSAIRTNDFGTGVLVLESAERSTTATPPQLKAIHETRQALMDDLISRASQGDRQAKAALALIERARSQ